MAYLTPCDGFASTRRADCRAQHMLPGLGTAEPVIPAATSGGTLITGLLLCTY